MASSRVLDAIVVGAGGAHGSAALYHLARRGAQVLGLEAQLCAPHDRGSSHGNSRIIRTAYFEHPSFVPLLHESFRLWRQLEAEAGETLLTITGCINAAAAPPPAAQAAVAGAPGPALNCYEGALLAAREHGLAHEVLSSAQVAQRFPAFHLPPGFQTCFEPGAGVLAPEACIVAHLRLAARAGAQLLTGAAATAWRVLPQQPGNSSEASGEALVQVDTSAGSFTARRLVLAAGGWMPSLVPELQPLLAVERQVVGWFEVPSAQRAAFSPERCPVFLLQDETGYFYGFPEDEHGFKVGKYNHLGELTTADAVERRITAEDEAALRQCLRYFPGAAGGRLAHAAACTFTNTPDSNFILDRHPRHPQVVLASACSGHGFKFAPVIGSVMADFALNADGATPHAADIALHRLSRDREGHAAVLDAFGRAGA